MRLRNVSRWLVPVVAVAGIAAVRAEDPDGVPTYRLTAVERKLLREQPAPEVALALGEEVAAGDVLRTGPRSSADILCPEAAARFRLGPKTRARLASDAPGVLLDLEQGRLHALFDKLSGGSRQRLVATPSAVLAVRGTEYGVEVSGKGTTTVVVFSGEVEVADRDGLGETVRVGAGQCTEVRRGEPAQPPIPHGMGPDQWDRGARPHEPAPSDARGSDGGGFGSWPGAAGSSGRPGAGSGGGGSSRGGGGGRG